MVIMTNCKHCGSENVVKAGIAYYADGKRRQKFLCKECRRITIPHGVGDEP